MTKKRGPRKLYCCDFYILFEFGVYCLNYFSYFLYLRCYLYCLFYVYGGWYVDLTLKMLTSVRVADHIDMIVFADRGCNFMSQPWAIQNGLMFSNPGNHIFIRAIDRICRY